MLVAAQSALQVAHGNGKTVDREIGCGPKRDERATLSDKARERINAGVADPAAKLGPHGGGGESVQHIARRLVWQDDDVEPASEQASIPKVAVVDGRDRK